jgi:hypothetical protein
MDAARIRTARGLAGLLAALDAYRVTAVDDATVVMTGATIDSTGIVATTSVAAACVAATPVTMVSPVGIAPARGTCAASASPEKNSDEEPLKSRPFVRHHDLPCQEAASRKLLRKQCGNIDACVVPRPYYAQFLSGRAQLLDVRTQWRAAIARDSGWPCSPSWRRAATLLEKSAGV